VRLVRGHVRVIDAGDESAPARVTTPALEVAAAGTDTEVFAFPEKAYLVSMVCALEGQVRAASVAGESATVAEGGCAIAKPLEGIYAAGGAGSALAPVGAAGPAGAPRSASGTAADHFAGPDDVAGGARLFAAHTAPSFDLDQQLFTACSGAAAAACAASAPPPNPPSNPPIPGLPPPGFPPPNPPSNSPVPGLPPTP